MKKLLSVLVLSVGLLTGCGAEKPASTVNEFLTSFQERDFENVGSHISGGIDELSKDSEDKELTMTMLKEISKTYEFEKPVEVSVSGDKAEVEVKITSIDVGVAMTSTISEVMPLAFASAFSENPEESEKEIDKLMEKTIIKHLSSEDTPMATRTVKLDLEKNKDGVYKIVSNDNLVESILANIDTVEKMFGEEVVEEEEEQPEQTSSVIYNVAKDKNYDVNPIKVNIEEVSFKKAVNVPEDEQERIAWLSEKEIGKEFNYLYIKYNAENTSDEDYTFSGVNEIVIFSEGKQERIDYSINYDFIDYDEGHDETYYGKINKEGEIGVAIDTDPTKVDKVRLVIDESLKDDDSYETVTDEQVVELEIKQGK